MVELRWLLVEVTVPVHRDDCTYAKLEKVLQYRQLVDHQMYAGFARPTTPTLEWSPWIPVPVA